MIQTARLRGGGRDPYIFVAVCGVLACVLLTQCVGHAEQADSAVAEPVMVIKGEGTDPPQAVAFSPDERCLVVGHALGSLRVVSLQSGDVVNTLSQGKSVTFVGFSEGDGVLISVTGLRTVLLRDSRSYALTGTLEAPARERIGHLAVSPKGGVFVTSGILSKKLYAWDIRTQKAWLLCEDQQTIEYAAFSPDGKYVVTTHGWGQDSIKASIWDFGTGKLVQRAHLDEHAFMAYVAYAPDGCTFATSSTNMVYLWDAHRLTLLRKWKHFPGFPTDLAFVPDSKFLIVLTAPAETEAGPGHVRFWGVRSGNLAITLHSGEQGGNCLAVSRGGRWLACGAGNGAVSVWDLRRIQEATNKQGTAARGSH